MKHPILSSRERQFIWWLVWLVTGASQSLFFASFGVPIELGMVDGMVSMILFSGLILALWFPFRTMNVSSKGVPYLLMNHIVAAAVTIGIWLGLTYLLNSSFPGRRD